MCYSGKDYPAVDVSDTVPELMDNAFYRGEIRELSVIPDCDE